MKRRRYNLIVITGPTATGKTRRAVRLAHDLGGEIISADSRQVYRGMDLGTGKDIAEYVIDGKPVPVHLVDIVDPDEEFNLFFFQRHFYRIFSDIVQRGRVPILCGGTGLYVDAIVRGYRMAEVPENAHFRRELESMDMARLEQRLRTMNPRLHNTTDLVNKKRIIRAIEIAQHEAVHGIPDGSSHPMIVPFIIGITCHRDDLRKRIRRRLDERLVAGMVEEVRMLHEGGLSWERLDYFGLEYRLVSAYLRGVMEYNEMVTTLETRINQFAKRQMTWFRRMERMGVVIHWIEGEDDAAVRELVDRHGVARNILHGLDVESVSFGY